MTGKVLVVGDVMMDILVRASGPLLKGTDRDAEITIVDGGSAANQAAWLAACGVPVVLFAKVGADQTGTIGTRLRAEGIVPLLAGAAKRHSGRLITFVDDEGERSFFTDRGANMDLSFDDLPAGWIEDIGLTILSGYSFFIDGPRACMRQIMAAAIKADIPVIVDAASTGYIAKAGPEVFLKWTEGASIFVTNEDEAALLTNRVDAEDQLQALLQTYPTVILKRGAKGSLAGERGKRPIFTPAVNSEIVDTLGAGDAFLAGYVGSWRKGKDMVTCLSEGNRFGAEAVRQVGGRPPEHFGELEWS